MYISNNENNFKIGLIILIYVKHFNDMMKKKMYNKIK